MPVWDTFARRQKRGVKKAYSTDVPQQDVITPFLRQQISDIWIESIGQYVSSWYVPGEDPFANIIFQNIQRIARRELSDFHQFASPNDDPFRQCIQYLFEASTEGTLSIIEIAFNCLAELDHLCELRKCRGEIMMSGEEAVKELNKRFNIAGVGYQFEHDMIVAVNSQFIHTEAVSPAFSFLSQPGFVGALNEFEQANKYYRAGDNKTCILEAAKAVESTMKAIFELHNWSYNKQGNLSELMKTASDEGLVPRYMETPLQGLGTLRNKTSGHGQGQELVVVTDHEAAYGLHLAASNIVLLMKAHTAMLSKSAK